MRLTIYIIRLDIRYPIDIILIISKFDIWIKYLNLYMISKKYLDIRITIRDLSIGRKISIPFTSLEPGPLLLNHLMEPSRHGADKVLIRRLIGQYIWGFT